MHISHFKNLIGEDMLNKRNGLPMNIYFKIISLIRGLAVNECLFWTNTFNIEGWGGDIRAVLITANVCIPQNIYNFQTCENRPAFVIPVWCLGKICRILFSALGYSLIYVSDVIVSQTPDFCKLYISNEHSPSGPIKEWNMFQIFWYHL